MSKSTKYSAEVRERAVQLLMEHAEEYPSPRAAITSVAGKIGCWNRWVTFRRRSVRSTLFSSDYSSGGLNTQTTESLGNPEADRRYTEKCRSFRLTKSTKGAEPVH